MNTLENKNDTFRYWSEIWFKKMSIDFSKSYSFVAKNHLKNINSFIGDMPIDKIKAMDIDNIIVNYAEENPHTKKPTAKHTLKDMRNIASSVFEYAYDNDAIKKNPAKGRKIPKHSPVTYRRALTRQEQSWIIKMPHRMRIGALIMMLAGLRRGELIALTWNDIDFDKFMISVNKSVERVSSNTFAVKVGTKNSKFRTVSIPLELAIELETAKKQAISQYICCQTNGTIHSPSSWKRAWQSYQCDLNITFGGNTVNKYNPHGNPVIINKITPHMLRHTYATLLYTSGVDVLTASKLMGHADVKTTLEIYTHLEEMTKEKSIDKLDTYVTNLFNKYK